MAHIIGSEPSSADKAAAMVEVLLDELEAARTTPSVSEALRKLAALKAAKVQREEMLTKSATRTGLSPRESAELLDYVDSYRRVDVDAAVTARFRKAVDRCGVNELRAADPLRSSSWLALAGRGTKAAAGSIGRVEAEVLRLRNLAATNHDRGMAEAYDRMADEQAAVLKVLRGL